MKYIRLIVLGMGMLHAMEKIDSSQIMEVGKYVDKTGYWAILKNGDEIDASEVEVTHKGKKRVIAVTFVEKNNGQKETKMNDEWFNILKFKYEQHQEQQEEQQTLNMLEDCTLK